MSPGSLLHVSKAVESNGWNPPEGSFRRKHLMASPRLLLVNMGGFAPATASDGRRVGRPNVRFFASGQGRPVAIRDKNKRSDWDEWLAVSLA